MHEVFQISRQCRMETHDVGEKCVQMENTPTLEILKETEKGENVQEKENLSNVDPTF